MFLVKFFNLLHQRGVCRRKASPKRTGLRKVGMRFTSALTRIPHRGQVCRSSALSKSCCCNGLSQDRGVSMPTEYSADLFGFAHVGGAVVTALTAAKSPRTPAR